MKEDESTDESLIALREENEFLREAARSFGELAERLAKELREMRRAQARIRTRKDKRTWPVA
jgi:hypothetical protein